MHHPRYDHLQRIRAAWNRLARQIIPSAVISGATAAATNWLLVYISHHL